jgi:hypothetical protein
MTTTVRKSNKKEKMQSIYEEFILWFALPSPQKERLGIETLEDFSQEWGVTPRSLSRWKDRQGFEEAVRRLRKKWAFDKTGDVMYGIYKAAVKGNDKSQKLWMQLFEGFTETHEVKQTIKVEVSVNDIRFLIEGLPEPLRTKHYDNFRDLIIDAEQARRAGLLQDGTLTVGSQDEISDEADFTTHDVSDERANVIPRRHSDRVCADMEWQASPYNHQSAARGW